LIVATLVAYLPAWHGGFIWDDDIYVSENPLLSAPDGLWRIWFSRDSPSQYFPLTYSLFRFEYGLWGLQTTGYHLVNIVLHAANALLVWRVLRRLGLPGARLAAALFALHPVTVESVAWITELKNVLSLLFCLLAMRAWIEFLDENRRGRKRAWYGLTLGLYALALLSKSTACTLPFALLLVAWFKGKSLLRPNREHARVGSDEGRQGPGFTAPSGPGCSILVQVLPFVALGLGMGLLAMWWERFHQGTEGQMFAVGSLARLLVASRAIWFYAGKLVWPAHLAFSYPRWNVSPGNPGAYGWLVLTLAAAGFLVLARRRLGRGVIAAVLFYVVTLAPMLGFIMLYTFRYTFVADHYQYAASIGPLALIAGVAVKAWECARGSWRHAIILLTVMAPIFLSVLTWNQSHAYADIETLWRATLEANPESFMAHNNLGNLLLRQDKLDAAIAHLQQAVTLRPDLAEAHSNLGNALSERGQLPEAVAEMQRALQLDPGFAEARNNLGTLLSRQGRQEEALEQYRQAVTIRPDFAEARKNLANTLLQAGKIDEAIKEFQEALRTHPELATAHNGLGNALLQKGATDLALAEFNKAIQLQPTLATAYNNRGTVWLSRGKLEAALADFQKAAGLRPDYPEVQNNLGKALLELGRVDDAIARFQQALAMRPDLAGARSNLDKALAQKQRVQRH
jgi:tetratricopeptide (TPR) repeat protein